MNIPQTSLDQIISISHLPKINEVIRALSPLALYGIDQSKSAGLNLWLYGGNFPTVSGVISIASQRLTLTPSLTNYIYADADGVVFRTTSIPDDWPGPMSSGARALYELSVGADGVTSGTCYLVGRGQKGPKGAKGATGQVGDGLGKQRKRSASFDGNGGTSITPAIGFATFPAFSANSRLINWQGSGEYSELVPYTAIDAMYEANNSRFIGNGSGIGGFDVSFRWAFDATFQHANQRIFVGLFNVAGGAIGNTEPSTLTNIIGIGVDAGDTNFSLMHNDGSGSATKTAITSSDSPTVSFKAVNTNDLYEFRLRSDRNVASTVTWELSNTYKGHIASGTITTNLPASSQALGFVFNDATGTAGGTVRMNVIHVIANSRY